MVENSRARLHRPTFGIYHFYSFFCTLGLPRPNSATNNSSDHFRIVYNYCFQLQLQIYRTEMEPTLRYGFHKIPKIRLLLQLTLTPDVGL
jgi:hypothetical protein